MTQSSGTPQIPVLIVGAGPVGVTIANLLGTYCVKALVIDRSPEVLDYPRAVGLDDEALRTFQAAGVAQALLKDMIQNVPLRMYSARKQCFAEILPSTREFGWCRRNLFSQPLGERALRAGLARFADITLELGTELVALAEDAQGVTATLRNSAGVERTVRADFVVAADGGRSTVRESLLQIPFDGKTHPRKWVVIECDQDPLDAPYTALHCEPQRPYVCLRLPHGLRRWEFMLFPGEDSEQMLAPAKVRELLGRHVADPSGLNVIRARVYTHNSPVAPPLGQGPVGRSGGGGPNPPPRAGARPGLQRPEIRELMERQGVLSPLELESRFSVYAEQYVLAIEVEARLVVRMVRTQIYPAVSSYLSRLIKSLQAQQGLGLSPCPLYPSDPSAQK